MTNKISDRADAFRTAGEAVGLLFGARAAELRAWAEGIAEGTHAARQAAGQCSCPPENDDTLDPGVEREARQAAEEILTKDAADVLWLTAELEQLRKEHAELLADYQKRWNDEAFAQAAHDSEPVAAEEDVPASAQAITDAVNGMTERMEAAAAGRIEPVIVSEPDYCGACGVTRSSIGILDHTPGCPNGNPPARRPKWAEVANRAEPEEDRHRI